MADTRYVREYAVLARHQAEVGAASRQRWIRIGIALPVIAGAAIGGFLVLPELGLFIAMVGGGVLFFLSMTGGSTVAPSALTGVEGEVAVLEELENLPNGWTVFNQVTIPDPQAGGYGRRELDFVVIGPRAVYVIEVKNVAGAIHVRPDEKHWPVARRKGCGNRPGWNAMDNPLKQTGAQVRAVESWLLQNGVACRVVPVLCFPHPGAMLADTDQSPAPVVGLHELIRTLQDHRPAPGEAPRTLKSVAQLLERRTQPGH